MSPSARQHLRRSGYLIAATSWLALISWGSWILWAHETTPGASGTPTPRWPAGSRLAFVRGRTNLVVAVHPRCPCTRASLTSLGEILKRSRGPEPAVRVLVFVPASGDGAWAGRSPLGPLEEMPGVFRVDDPGGAEASRFGLATSGQVIVFDRDGRERFAGGVDPGRGSLGESEGSAAVQALLEGQEAGASASPAFGCAVSSASRVPATLGGRR